MDLPLARLLFSPEARRVRDHEECERTTNPSPVESAIARVLLGHGGRTALLGEGMLRHIDIDINVESERTAQSVLKGNRTAWL